MHKLINCLTHVYHQTRYDDDVIDENVAAETVAIDDDGGKSGINKKNMNKIFTYCLDNIDNDIGVNKSTN